ncbi:hypothetical protein [Desulfuromonas sp. AOP6]|uniref:hypothetical protein n=1 Tax=Desulfuromonas sp. AOP6 TaxID=1566351 RepID=UPI00128388D4|nr:hypothetical protein [Desulfuromonas sp. AOP6]BCA79994.1 hypothetical protein AOP6_1781 [Desulfuromonas sp. AOP6]
MAERLLAGWELTREGVELPTGVAVREHFAEEPWLLRLEGAKYGKPFNLDLFSTFLTVEREISPQQRTLLVVAPKKTRKFTAEDFIGGLRSIMPARNGDILAAVEEEFLQPAPPLKRIYGKTYPPVAAVLIFLGILVVLYMAGVFVWALFQ